MTSIQTAMAAYSAILAKAVAHDNLINEGGYGYNPHGDAVREAGRAVTAAKLADRVANFATLRAAWNAAVVKYTTGEVVDMAKVVRDTGMTLTEMRQLKALCVKELCV